MTIEVSIGLFHEKLSIAVNYTFFFYKNMLSRSEPQKEIEIVTSKLTTMFLNFGKFEPQRSYKHGSYKKKKVYCIHYQYIFSHNNINIPNLKKIQNILDICYFVFILIVVFDLRL